LKAELGGRSVEIEPPSELQALDFALEMAPQWVKEGLISSDYFFRKHLSERRAAMLQVAVSPAAPQPPSPPPAPAKPAQPAAPTKPALPAPAKPVKPPAPPINWGKVRERMWQFATSGILLRGLLYLGAFMIEVAAAVLVIRFWQVLPLWMQIASVTALPLSFYGGGFALRAWLKTPVAGGVFTGIGALLIAVAFAGVYQFSELRGIVNPSLYWLMASVVCTALYIFTAWRVRGVFFAYLTLIGLSSTLMALVSAMRLPLEWWIASLSASGAAMMGAAGWLRHRRPESWGDLALASRRLPHLLIPISLFLVLLVPGDSAFGQMAAFLFAAFGYGLLAEYFPAVIFIHASAWCSVGAFGFALFGLGLPAEWYAAAAAALAPLYFLIGRLLRQQLIDFTPPRRGYRGAVNLVGFGLVIVAIVTGLIMLIVNVWAGITALALASAVLAWCAYFFRRPALAFIASGLFIAPFTVAVARWLFETDVVQWGAWLMAAWAGLALAYLGLAVLLRRAEKYVSWLNLWAHALTLLAMPGLLINYVLTMRNWSNGPTLIALGGLLAVYVASAFIHDGGRHPALSRFVAWLPSKLRQEIFLWPVGLLIPVWAAVAWWGTVFTREWFGAVLAGLALVYVGVGQLLARRNVAYRFPPHAYAYGLTVISVLVALNAKAPLMTSLYLAVVVLASLAFVYRRVAETAVASALFLWPFFLTLQLLNVTPHAFSLAYALLAAFGYVPLGIALDKVGCKFARPHYAIGYGLAALAVVASLGGRFDFYPMNVPWVGVAVPLIVVGLQIFSLYRFRQLPFAWAAAGVFPLAFGQALTLLRLPSEYDAAAWVGLAFAYLIVERGLVLTVSVGSLLDKIRERSQSFRLPLGLGAIALGGLGLLLTAPDTAQAFAGIHLPNYFPPLLAQTLAMALVVIAARLYHSRWPIFCEPPLAFVAVTLFFIGYSERLLGVALVAAQFGIVWSALGIVHLIVAALLDRDRNRDRIRYSHGLYIGGYLLIALAVAWTLALFAREALLWTLGLGLVAALGSALSVHFNRHHSWDELLTLILGDKPNVFRTAVRGAFIWAAAWPFPIWCVLLLQQLNVADGFYWLGFGVPAILMLGLAIWLRRIERTYAWPLNIASHFYTAFGLLISAPLTDGYLSGQFSQPGVPIEITRLSVVGFIVLQTAAVVFYAASARTFRWRLFAYVAAWLSFLPYTLAWVRFTDLPRVQFGILWSAFAIAHLVIAALLDRSQTRYSHGPYTSGYAIVIFSIVWTLLDRGTLLWTLGLGIAVAIGSALLVHFNRHYSWDELINRFFGGASETTRIAVRGAFIWAAAWPFPIWCVLLLQQLNVANGFYWLGFGVSALALLALAVWLRRFERTYAWPLHSAAQVYTALGLLISAPLAIRWLSGQPGIPGEPFLVTRLTVTGFITSQTAAVIFYAASARVFRWRLFTLISAALTFFPLTLLFIGYSTLKSAQFSLVWIGLALVHLCLAALLDRNKTRYSHGLYLAGYALAPFAIVWTVLDDRLTLVWTLGLGIAIAAGSALLVHLNRHWTWDEVIDFVFGPKASRLRSTARGAFLWLAAWPLPIWCVLLLQQLNVANGFYWLGFGVSALALLGLTVWLRRFERTYAWPLNTAAQFYTALGLLISAPLTLRWLAGQFSIPGEPFAITQLTLVGFIVLQTAGLIFYAASSWAHRTRLFAHVAAWLSFVPFTLTWIRFAPALSAAQIALPWIGLATALLVVGFALDRKQVRYAHGPYLAGYALAGFALMWSALARDRLVNLYTLAAVIALALVSHAMMHYGRHRSFDDFISFFWRKQGTVPQRTARTIFLFFAAYAVPVWLAQFMAYQNVPLAWRGLGLALAAPIYIAFGLAARRVRREYTWPLYSAGYALTAIGAMVAFDDLAIAIYVLALNTVVYAVSAYIFRQAFWLYLANALVPIIALLTLHYNDALTAPWVAGLFMGLAFVYFFIGQWFNRRHPSPAGALPRGEGDASLQGVGTFALAFHAPGYLLSALALAVASGDTWLAIEIYSAGVGLYAISAWTFRESVFLYPAVWLAAVPYYLIMTLTPLPADWRGIGWLPLIIACILVGKFVFHRNSLGSFKASARGVWDASLPPAHTPTPLFTHPALPFYLLAYPLSVSMIVLSQPSPLTFTLALAAGAAIYFASAALFRRPVWLYPGLFAAHLALMSYFTIHPSDKPAQYISLPFLGLTWMMALTGYVFSRRFPVSQQTESGKRIFNLGRWNWEFGNWPFVGHLLTPSWAQPFFIFTALDLIGWQLVALGRYETAIIVATGFMLLLMLFAMFWQDSALAYGTLIFFLIAVGYWLDWAGLPLADSFARVGGIGFGCYLLARIAERARLAPAAVWIKPLTHAAIALTGLAVVVTLPFVLSQTTDTAFALAFAGALYLTIAYRGHYHRLGYTAMAMLQAAWALLLIVGKVAEPQLYAIPAGLYFTGIGYLERRRSRKLYAIIIESFGLAVLLLTAFIQSLNGGVEGLPHFVLLIVEGLLVIWWGASRRLKLPFFVGLAASAINVVGQVVVAFSGGDIVIRVLIIFGAGVIIITAGLIIERLSLLAKVPEWLEALEEWE